MGGNGNGEEICTRHSGLESKNNLLLWLLGILIVIGATQTTLIMSMKAEISGFSYRFTAADQGRNDIKSEMIDIKSRVSKLEQERFNRKGY